jgi:hypothetical protein
MCDTSTYVVYGLKRCAVLWRTANRENIPNANETSATFGNVFFVGNTVASSTIVHFSRACITNVAVCVYGVVYKIIGVLCATLAHMHPLDTTREHLLSVHLSGSRIAMSLYGMITVHAVLVVLSLGDPSAAHVLWAVVGTIVFVAVADTYSLIVGRHIDKKSPMRPQEFAEVWSESGNLLYGASTIVIFFGLATLEVISVSLAFTLSYISSALVLFFYGIYYAIHVGEPWGRAVWAGTLNAGIVYGIILLKGVLETVV